MTFCSTVVTCILMCILHTTFTRGQQATQEFLCNPEPNLYYQVPWEPAIPSPRAMAITGTVGSDIIVAGGCHVPEHLPLAQLFEYCLTEKTSLNTDVWKYSLENEVWTLLHQYNASISIMAGKTGQGAVANNTLFYFGGLVEFYFANSVFSGTLMSITQGMSSFKLEWEPQEGTDLRSIPGPRYGHSLVAIDDSHLVLFGGYGLTHPTTFGHDANMVLNGTFIYNIAERSWVPFNSPLNSSTPSARYLHCAASINSTHMAMFGGLQRKLRPFPDGVYRDTWIFSLSDGWVQIHDAQQLARDVIPAIAFGQYAATCTSTSDGMLLLGGGVNSCAVSLCGAFFRADSLKWTLFGELSLPPQRFLFSSASGINFNGRSGEQSEIFLIGGLSYISPQVFGPSVTLMEKVILHLQSNITAKFSNLPLSDSGFNYATLLSAGSVFMSVGNGVVFGGGARHFTPLAFVERILLGSKGIWLFNPNYYFLAGSSLNTFVPIVSELSPTYRYGATTMGSQEVSVGALFGGYTRSLGTLNDTWVFDSETLSWHQVEQTEGFASPPGRCFAAGALTLDNGAFLFGGFLNCTKTSVFLPHCSIETRFNPITGETSYSDPSCVALFDGDSKEILRPVRDLWHFNLHSETWLYIGDEKTSEIWPPAFPIGHTGTSMVAAGNNLVIPVSTSEVWVLNTMSHVPHWDVRTPTQGAILSMSNGPFCFTRTPTVAVDGTHIATIGNAYLQKVIQAPAGPNASSTTVINFQTSNSVLVYNVHTNDWMPVSPANIPAGTPVFAQATITRAGIFIQAPTSVYPSRGVLDSYKKINAFNAPAFFLLACPPGYKQSGSGAASPLNCTVCPFGTYSSKSRASVCTPCAGNSYTNISGAPGAEFCNVCRSQLCFHGTCSIVSFSGSHSSTSSSDYVCSCDFGYLSSDNCKQPWLLIGVVIVILIVTTTGLVTLLIVKMRSARRTAKEEAFAARSVEHLNTVLTRAWMIDESELQLERAPLSQGGFGVVRKGIAFGNVPVAVKRMIGDSDLEPEELCEFEQEIRLLQQLRHVNIVRFFGYTHDEGRSSMVMEYCANGSLDTLLETRSKAYLSWDLRVRLTLDVAKGMRYLHSETPTKRTIIHRDLKSPNVLINDVFTAKIADLGQARHFDRTGPLVANEGKFQIAMKQVGSVIGRRKYRAQRKGFGDLQNMEESLLSAAASSDEPDVMMTGGVGSLMWRAPELLESQRDSHTAYTPMVDIYSFGIIMAEVAMCTLPYADKLASDRWFDIRGHVLSGGRPPALGSCSPSFRQIMTTSWSKNPKSRPSFETIVPQLEEILSAVGNNF